MLTTGDRFICPNTPYFKQKGVANQEVQVICITDYFYRVWTKTGPVSLSMDEVDKHTNE